MADTSFYDVIVCGGELGGLVAAALLARRGFRVLLCGDEPGEAAFEARGVTLSRRPAVLPPLDDPQSARVLKELDIAAVVRGRAPVAPSTRIVLSKRPLDLAADAGTLARALGGPEATLAATIDRLETVGRMAEPLLATAMTLPPHGFWERREVGRLASLLPRAGTDLLAPLAGDHPFRAVAAAPAALGCALVPSDVGAVAEARAFSLARRETPVFDGGLAALQKLLRQRIETFGGDRRTRVEPVGLALRRGRVVGLRVSPRDETIGCRFLLWASRPGDLGRMLGGAATARPPATPRVTGYRYGLALEVDPAGLPEGSPTRFLAIADPARPLLEDNAVAVTLGQPAPRTAGRVPAWAECAVAAHLVDAGPSYLAALRGRIQHTLGRCLPDLARNIELCASPYDGLPPELRGDSIPAASRRSTAGAVPLPPALYGRATTGPLDLLGLPHATGIKHLFFVGRENLPGLGLEGELVAGWGAARLVGEGPLRRATFGRRTLMSG